MLSALVVLADKPEMSDSRRKPRTCGPCKRAYPSLSRPQTRRGRWQAGLRNPRSRGAVRTMMPAVRKERRKSSRRSAPDVKSSSTRPIAGVGYVTQDMSPDVLDTFSM